VSTLSHLHARKLEKRSGCKVNLLLNILGKRVDGFHELETVMLPVPVYDHLTFSRGGDAIELECNLPGLPVDSRNLVHRAAERFLATAHIEEGVRITLEKAIPLAAGLGGGSGNAACTVLALNELFGSPLAHDALVGIAATLGSDIPFFLQDKPALGTGRGENITSLEPFPALTGAALVLIHPGFGISTPWAYQQLARFPEALHGRPGRAQPLLSRFAEGNLNAAGRELYNSLEAPALQKYPILRLYQDFFRREGAAGTLMSGSGSTTFAIAANVATAEGMAEGFKAEFGDSGWVRVVAL